MVCLQYGPGHEPPALAVWKNPLDIFGIDDLEWKGAFVSYDRSRLKLSQNFVHIHSINEICPPCEPLGEPFVADLLQTAYHTFHIYMALSL